MGEAKRRGTYEERKAAAQKSVEAVRRTCERWPSPKNVALMAIIEALTKKPPRIPE